MNRIVRFFALVLALLGASEQTGAAQEPTPLPPAVERTAVEAMSRLRSPHTASHTVDMCPSAGALRDSIRVAAAGGQSTDQIVEAVIARHGEQLRLLPRRSGAGLWAWLLPPLVILGGAAAIYLHLRPGDERGSPAAGGESLSDDERAELAAAMHDWETGARADA